MTGPRTFTGDWNDDDIDVAIATGQVDIDRWDVAHDERLDELDRLDEKGPARPVAGALDAVIALYPDRAPSSDVTPLGRRAA
ncbi:MAG: hypothetical protein JWM47_4564 [Acidimicrobiales bacterium]|nr:hypothetical protein [Acidimicrobiales bacterium]